MDWRLFQLIPISENTPCLPRKWREGKYWAWWSGCTNIYECPKLPLEERRRLEMEEYNKIVAKNDNCDLVLMINFYYLHKRAPGLFS